MLTFFVEDIYILLIILLANVNLRLSLLYDRRPSVRLSVCLSVCRLSVTFVHTTQVIEIFGNVSTPFGTLAICDLLIENFTELVPGEPLRRGVKPKRGSKI